ncbi:hypothetical protein A2635_00435 [Candidatus Peribacteria bacterium RIFCSPHIGHO2_01_FULL_51_9]|nr:MAG: hypothetical protein A2635_00435 [Candidatus Peribacteria bacterium RIFCSPHIGHO2_01_FULL_51_9]
MKPYSTFIFESYSFDPKTGQIALRYSLDNELKFEETLVFSQSSVSFDSAQDDTALKRALFALHLIGGISYYKTCCPKKIEIRSGVLGKEQAQFWNMVYTKGLGEFFYKNNIDFRNLIQFPYTPNPTPSVLAKRVGISDHPKTLVPMGGGKDSTVTIEKLRASDADITLFRMGSHPLINKIANIANLPLLTVERHLSPILFELNEQGALNGHIPITAYLSFLTIIIAILFDFEEVAMSNEKSASEGNREFNGEQINHQWSKSEEFEQLFQNYVRTFITPEIHYKNILRDLTEFEIAKEFCKYPQYFDDTTSCNTNWRLQTKDSRLQTAKWCGSCPKCAFVFALFAAYLPKETLLRIFGKNLFDDASLLPMYKQLLGQEGFKPFECVGTAEETREAFALARKREEWNDTVMMNFFENIFPTTRHAH